MSEASLQQLLGKGRLPRKSFRLAILKQIAAALDQANTIDSIHGNLTPESIIISEEPGRGYVVVNVKDFGTTFVLDQEMVMGSGIPDGVHYLSPERILGIDVDGQSDEFSFAAIAYELLCGKKPFEAAGISELFYNICTESAAPIEAIDSTLNSTVDAVLKRALAKSPRDRFASCGDFVEALGAALQSSQYGQEKVPLAAAMAAGAGEPTLSRTAAPNELRPQPEFEIHSYRERRRYSEEDDSERAEPRTKKLLIIAAICFFVAGIGVSVWHWAAKRNSPAPVLDSAARAVTPVPVPPNETTTGTARPYFVSPPPTSTRLAGEQLEAEQAARKPVPATNEKATLKQGAASSTTKLAEGGVASVDLLTEPPGSRIAVDDSINCTAPCTLSLPHGRHTLIARLTGFATEQRIFTVPEDSSLFIALSRQLGTLVVTSVPTAATIVIDGKDYGLTPATLHLPPGQHRLTLMNGSQQHIATVTVVADAIQASAYNFGQ